jgi:hypothetical protein
MATHNPALDAAGAQFAQQPGVSPHKVAQLRAALASDPSLTAALGAAASSGTLHGFALSASGAPDRPVGGYVPGPDIVTLPASAFPAPGAPASSNLHATLRMQAMGVEFSGKSFADSGGATHPVTPDMLTNLQDTMNGSPALANSSGRRPHRTRNTPNIASWSTSPSRHRAKAWAGASALQRSRPYLCGGP